MMLRKTMVACGCLLGVCALGSPSNAQNTPTTLNPQPDVVPTSASGPSDVMPLHYEVSEVKGRVRISKIGTDPKLDAGWTQVKLGDSIVGGTQISVPFRGAVKLVAVPADPPTVIMLESGSLVAFAELGYTEDKAKSRIKLGYGAIRAGVAEGEVRSDMEIECPVATLSKKGTDIFRFEYYDGKWSMSLSPLGRGVIQAIQHRYDGMITNGRPGLGTRSRFILPGQWVNQQMSRTIETALFDKIVNINDVFGLQDIELKFNQFFGNGLGFMLVGKDPIGLRQTAGQEDGNKSNASLPALQSSTSGFFQNTSTLALGKALSQIRDQAAIRNNTGGDFGVGQGVVGGLFGRNPVSGLRARTPDMQRAAAKMNLMKSSGGRKGG